MRVRGPRDVYAGVQRRTKRFLEDAATYLNYRSADYRTVNVADLPGVAASSELLSANNPMLFSSNLATYLNQAARSLAPDGGLLERCQVAVEQILEGDIQVYGRRLGPRQTVDWNADVTGGGVWPRRFFTRYRYLVNGRRGNYGDYRHTWELNRQQHLLLLSLVYGLSGNERHIACVMHHIRSWISQNPPFWSLNWISSMELGLRMVSWCLALTRVPVRKLPEDFRIEVLLSIYQQMRFLIENLSVEFADAGSKTVLKNNHTILELCCVMTVSALLPPLAEEAGLDKSKLDEYLGYLLIELERQTSADGMQVEQASSYLRFVLEALLLTRMVVSGSEALDPYIHGYMSALNAFRYTGDRIFLVGDEDNGHMFFPHFDARPDSVREVLDMYEVLYSDANSIADTVDVAFGDAEGEGCSILGDSGHWLSRVNNGQSQVRLYFRAGRMDFPEIPGYAPHAHCDLLSINLAIDGELWLVDRGTYTYRDRVLQDELRSSEGHNTLIVEGFEQMRLLGAFHSDSHAVSEMSIIGERSVSGVVTINKGERKISMNRRVVFDTEDMCISVHDSVEGLCGESIRLLLNLHPQVEVSSGGVLSRPGGKTSVTLDGWEDAEVAQMLYSPRYGVDTNANQLVLHLGPGDGPVMRKQWSMSITPVGGA